MAAKYSIGTFSKKTGTTIRALRYYDEIGLLKPTFITDSGHRYYSDDDILTLQKIVSLKYLGYSLEKINEFLHLKDWDLKDSLSFLKDEMLQKKLHLENVIRALDHALHMMDDQEQIDSSIFISLIQNIQMEKEHKEWLKGYIAEEKVEQLYNIPEEKMLDINKRTHIIIAQLKQACGQDPASEHVQTLIHNFLKLVDELTGNYLDIINELSGKEIDFEKEAQIFYSPLSDEEEKWAGKAIEIYFKKKGLMSDE